MIRRTALNEILYMGRQVRMYVLLVAQSATARALGGPEVREQLSTRILARYSVNAWRMLAPEVHPAPKSTKHRARDALRGSVRGDASAGSQRCSPSDLVVHTDRP
ncbi:hypothetical protein ACFWWM_25995 [Streptomyces sp. NPDC058682]|uniref:hypothetical protein n=1 Tax=Streptomyces sp. NPDC058682 TaxID=3346596 RepID=UPI003667A3CF